MNGTVFSILFAAAAAAQGCLAETRLPARDGPLHVITHGADILYLDAKNPEEPSLKVKLIRISEAGAVIARNGVEVLATEGTYLFPEEFGQKGLKVRKIDIASYTVSLERAFAEYSKE